MNRHSIASRTSTAALPQPTPSALTAQRWDLARNCSLTPRQTLLAWALPLVAGGACALLFTLAGYGVIGLFWLLQALAVGIAVRSYALHARDGDTVTLHADQLLHIECRRGAARSSTVWQAARVRMEIDAQERWTLWTGPQRLQVGNEVPGPSRRRAAQELEAALRRSRSAT